MKVAVYSGEGVPAAGCVAENVDMEEPRDLVRLRSDAVSNSFTVSCADAGEYEVEMAVQEMG